MKRRVASLPPVSAHVFDQKVLERRAETAIAVSAKGSTCDVCNKVYTTENTYRSHISSKKHRENQLKASASLTPQDPIVVQDDAMVSAQTEGFGKQASACDESSDDEINRTIDEKIAAARTRLSTSHCLFCPLDSMNIADNLTHMSMAHSFFIPDADYLIDISGLISYLGEKIAVGNICIFCNGKSREFRTLEAVRKHMMDKSHCKMAYDSPDDRLEISDYYDFTSSYPDAARNTRKDHGKTVEAVHNENSDVWEDVKSDDEGGDVDEIIDEDLSSEGSQVQSDDEILPDNTITYGDSHLELVLPSGARIGHRTMRKYYAQTFPAVPRARTLEDPNSGAALVRRLLTDKNAALIPRKGGFGAFGAGTDVMKARNRGEAREAGRHVREYRDQKHREDFKTKVGFIHNSQKHYRDPLLQ